MPTDNERREVARRLLKVAKKLGPNMDAHEFAHYTADVLDVDDSMTWYEMELRLADLIEPSCDRDALLALADEMDEDAIGLAFISQLEENEELQDLQSTMAKALMDYARRIREALGVES